MLYARRGSTCVPKQPHGGGRRRVHCSLSRDQAQRGQVHTSVDTRPPTCSANKAPMFTVALSSWQASFLSPESSLRNGTHSLAEVQGPQVSKRHG